VGRASGGPPDRRADVGLFLSLLVLAALVFSHLTVTQLSGVFALAPVIASTTLSVRRTLLVALLAAGSSLMVAPLDPYQDTLGWLTRAALCALIGAVAVCSAYNRVRREHELLQMTAIADTAQRALLRALPTTLGPINLAARHVSATANALIGGDLYEAVSTPYGVRIIIGDVRGKGIGAVQLAATVLGAFRQASATQPDLPSLVRAIDAVVAGVIGEEDFVTALLVQVSEGDEVQTANCGHHPPLLVTADSAAQCLDTGSESTPLGLSPDPVVATNRWPVDGRLLLYTDGLVEARDLHGDFFPLEQNADTLLGVSLPDALEALARRLLGHTGRRLHDDMALVLIERRPVLVTT